MLPKIAVGVSIDRKEMMAKLGLSEHYTMCFEGDGAKVSDLRSWINSAMNIARNKTELSLVIWDADKLSEECQAVLLKPMEEVEESVRLVLVVENENNLSPTILSRAVVENLSEEKRIVENWWSEIRKCWSSGPSACIAFSDKIDKTEAPLIMEEIILKLKGGLSSEVNEKRLAILSLALETLSELQRTNINYKLSLDNFLISSWRMIKS